MVLNKDELGMCVRWSWSILVDGLKKDAGGGITNVEGRNKIKSLVLPLREYDDPEAAVLHFVKHSEYYLPRARTPMRNTLRRLLVAVAEINSMQVEDREKKREMVQYLVGYLAWSLEAVQNIMKSTGRNRVRAQEEIKTMIDEEFKLCGITDMKPEDMARKLVENEGGR